MTNFRNFSQVELDLSQITLLVGNNAQGKSNLLESIYFLATSKSSRAEKDWQLIKTEDNFCRVGGEIDQENEAISLEIFMQKKEDQQRVEKRLKVNGIGRRAFDYLGNLIAVHFTPEDINLVTGPPALRRWHLDLTLAQIDKKYKTALNEYHTALVSRNRILKGIKEGTAKTDELDFWTDQMVKSGEIITEKRQEFFQFINGQSFAKHLGQFRFLYQPSLISSDRVREYLSREVAAAMSLIGPHRDDFIFKLDSRDLAYFGSRGEQRTAVLELKLAELKFISQTQQTRPVLLLDDIFSELDQIHRDFITSIIDGAQIILSAVEESQVPEKLVDLSKIIKVEKGRIGILR